MTTLEDFQNLIIKGLGGRDDAIAIAVINASVNYAATMAALLFKPSELEKQGDLTITGGSNYITTSTLVNYLEAKLVYNTTDANKMWLIPWESWYIFLPTTVGKVKYFSIFGDRLYVKDTPVVNKILAISYLTYPTKLINASDTLEFNYHDSYIISVALAICWAFFEEGESAATMQKIAEAAGASLALSSTSRTELMKTLAEQQKVK